MKNCEKVQTVYALVLPSGETKALFLSEEDAKIAINRKGSWYHDASIKEEPVWVNVDYED